PPRSPWFPPPPAAGSWFACIFRRTPKRRRALKVTLRARPYIHPAGLASRVPSFPRRASMQAKFHLKQITVALAAAGFGLAVGAGYNRLDTAPLSLANAGT